MRKREHVDRGAAAVEFALVVPVLVLLLLGVVDYGIYFTDSLGARQGMREGARQGVVETFPTNACNGQYGSAGSPDELDQLACRTLQNMGIVGGQAFVRIQAVDGWTEGEDLLLCGAVDEKALTGYTPLPGGGNLRTMFRMRIEQDDAPHSSVGEARTQAGTAGSALEPSGGWSWCT